MALIKDGAVVEDAWITVSDDAALPDAPVIVSFERWQAERDRLKGRNAPLGIRLASGQSLDEIAGDLDWFSVIALEFPVFTDGRAFTTARILRERYGFFGEIRAVGDVLRDQILFMVRCGFDAFEMEAGENAEDWRAAVAEINIFYQAAADRRLSVMEFRHS